MKRIITVLLIAAMFAAFSTGVYASGFTTADALNILRAVAGIAPLTAEQQDSYGISGIASTNDALRVLRIVAGISETPQGNISVGSIIRFGDYDWRVLDVQDGRALILTDRIIGKRDYKSSGTGRIHSWADSDIRGWLNGAFYNSFNAADRARIQQTTLNNAANQWFGAAGGIDTSDYIFLLSIEEVVKYFGDSGQLRNRPDEAWWIEDQFDEARKAFCITCPVDWCGIDGESPGNLGCSWWLRSPGVDTYTAAQVYGGGALNISGSNMSVESGVRPAMWVEIN